MNKVVDLDGVLSQWSATGYSCLDERPRSSHHIACRKLLKELYPACQTLEEVKIQIRRGEWLYVDFYIPNFDIMVEVQGEQHYKFSPFFHKTKIDFLMQKKRDREKAEWCELNLVQLIILPYNENIDEWKSRFG